MAFRCGCSIPRAWRTRGAPHRGGICDSALDACSGADCAVIATEWPEFRDLDVKTFAGAMRGHTIVDLRNLLDRDVRRRRLCRPQHWSHARLPARRRLPLQRHASVRGTQMDRSMSFMELAYEQACPHYRRRRLHRFSPGRHHAGARLRGDGARQPVAAGSRRRGTRRRRVGRSISTRAQSASRAICSTRACSRRASRASPTSLIWRLRWASAKA